MSYLPRHTGWDQCSACLITQGGIKMSYLPHYTGWNCSVVLISLHRVGLECHTYLITQDGINVLLTSLHRVGSMLYLPHYTGWNCNVVLLHNTGDHNVVLTSLHRVESNFILSSLHRVRSPCHPKRVSTTRESGVYHTLVAIHAGKGIHPDFDTNGMVLHCFYFGHLSIYSVKMIFTFD